MPSATVKVRPLGDRVIVRPIDLKEQRHGSIIIPDSAKEKPQEGEIIAAGPGQRLKNGQMVPLEVKKGDKVLFGRYSGTEVKLEEGKYLILRETDILAVL